MTAWRVRDVLAAARAAAVDRLDAQWLLEHVLQQPRAWLIAHDDALLSAQQTGALQALLARRATGEPLAYVTGERIFCGLRLHVTPDVLVPRPETELLVDWAGACLLTAPAQTVVDLGTGSGAIALALAHAAPVPTIAASDASDAALAVARANGQRLGFAVDWQLGDWWAPWAGRRFGLAVANPPYIAGDDAHLAALGHEPRAALTPGGDGLDALRHIIGGAPAHLLPGAWLLLEHGHDQGPAVRQLLRDAGFYRVETRNDLADLPRCSGGVWRPPAADQPGTAN